MDVALIIIVAAFGLLAGSFLNVVIYRIPRKESIVLPASHCPACEHPLKARDNIPVVSYLVLRGKCRDCGAPISAQYPLVEAATALMVVASLVKYGLTPAFGLAVFFLLVLLTVSVIDIHLKIIPNAIIVPAICIGALLIPLYAATSISHASLIDQPDWKWPLLGFLLGGGLLLLLAVLWPNGMGGGDIKLAAFMGLFLGRYVVIALFVGFLLGALGGVLAMALLGKGRKDQLPFGPYLAVGSLVTLYVGLPLAQWYLPLAGFG